MHDLKGLSPEDREVLKAQVLEEIEAETKADFYGSTEAKVQASIESASSSLAREVDAIQKARTVSLSFFSMVKETIINEELFGMSFYSQARVKLSELLANTDNWSLPTYGDMDINVNDPHALEDWTLILASAFGEGKRSAYGNQNIVLEWEKTIKDLTKGDVKSIRWNSSLNIKLIASPEAHGCKLIEIEVLVPARTIKEHVETHYEITCK